MRQGELSGIRSEVQGTISKQEKEIREALTQLRARGLRKNGPEAWEEPFTPEELEQMEKNREKSRLANSKRNKGGL
jgi:hypothetical protein